MKITCEKNNLLQGINIAMRAVPSKTTLPILESFLICVENNEIRIISNDNEMGIETLLRGEIYESGKIAINARLFSEIIRKLPDSLVTVESDGNFKLYVYCEDIEIKLNGHSAEEFPELPEINENNKIIMSQFSLKEIIRQTIFSVSQAEINALMKGEFLEIKGDKLRIISMDSHRISIRNVELSEKYGETSVIIPGKALNEISRILSDDNEKQVIIIIDEKFVKFIFNETIVVTRTIEGEFFDIDRMISSDYETVIKVNKNEFLSNIDRAFTLAKEGEKKPIVMKISENVLDMEISSSLGQLKSKNNIETIGKPLVIGFNPRFLMEALKVIDDEIVSLFFINSNAPCFIKNEENDYNYVILPVNINR